MTAIAGFRRMRKRRLVILVPESIDDRIRETANRERKSRSEVGTIALASALGIALDAPSDTDARAAS